MFILCLPQKPALYSSRHQGVSARGVESWACRPRWRRGWAHTPVSRLLPNPGGLCRMGLGGWVGGLPKTSPLVTQPPGVAAVTLGDRSGWQCWLRGQRQAKSGAPPHQVSQPLSPWLAPSPVSPSHSLEYHPQGCRGLALRALVLSHLVRWQEPPESHQRPCQGPAMLPLKKVGGCLVPVQLSALFHFSWPPPVLLQVWGAVLRGQSPSGVLGCHLHRREGYVSDALLPIGLVPQRAQHGFCIIMEITAWYLLIKKKKSLHGFYPVAEYEISCLLQKGHCLQ